MNSGPGSDLYVRGQRLAATSCQSRWKVGVEAVRGRETLPPSFHTPVAFHRGKQGEDKLDLVDPS